MSYAGGAAAGAAAAIAHAIKASGVIVKVEPDQFELILSKQSNPLVVTAEGGFFKKKLQYLASYKGLAFFSESIVPINLPNNCEIIAAGKIWIPG